MRNFFTFVLLLIVGIAVAQVDTVCFSSTALSVYTIPSPAEGTPQWTVTGGTIVSGQSTNSIQVNWSNQPVGLIPNAVKVILLNTSCPSPVQSISVFIFRPNFQPSFSISCPDSPCLPLNFPGANGTWSGSFVSEEIFCPPSAGTFPIQFAGIYMGCYVTANGTVVVGNSPTLGPISWQ
jgi:hypothetical protein